MLQAVLSKANLQPTQAALCCCCFNFHTNIDLLLQAEYKSSKVPVGIDLSTGKQFFFSLASVYKCPCRWGPSGFSEQPDWKICRRSRKSCSFSAERRNSPHFPDADFLENDTRNFIKFCEFAEFFTCCLVKMD